jgi:hypothetical protein
MCLILACALHTLDLSDSHSGVSMEKQYSKKVFSSFFFPLPLVRGRERKGKRKTKAKIHGRGKGREGAIGMWGYGTQEHCNTGARKRNTRKREGEGDD